MKRYILIAITIVCSIIAASVIWAADFDGSKPLLVSVIRVIECTPDGGCHETAPANVDLPQFLKIDFSKKTIRPAASGDETPASPIERQEVVDGTSSSCRVPRTVMKRCTTVSDGLWPSQRQPGRWC